MNNSYPPSTAPRDSTLATVSLIAGILGLTLVPGLASLIALITGYMAKREIEESGGMIGGERSAKLGITLGWVAVGIGVIAGCCVALFFGSTFFLPILYGIFGDYGFLPGWVALVL